MANVGTLTVALDTDADGLRKGVNRATVLVAEGAKRMEASYSQSKGDKFALQVRGKPVAQEGARAEGCLTTNRPRRTGAFVSRG
jgi:hypothetical protein